MWPFTRRRPATTPPLRNSYAATAKSKRVFPAGRIVADMPVNSSSRIAKMRADLKEIQEIQTRTIATLQSATTPRVGIARWIPSVATALQDIRDYGNLEVQWDAGRMEYVELHSGLRFQEETYESPRARREAMVQFYELCEEEIHRK